MANGDGGFDVPAGTVVMETAVDMQGIDRGLREVEKRGEEAGKAAGEGFGSGFGEKVSEDGASSAAEEFGSILEDTGDKAERAGQKVESADEKIDELEESMETTAEAGTGLAAVLISKVSRGATKTMSTVVGLAEIGFDFLAQSMGNLGRQLQQRSDEMEHFGAVAEGTGRILEGTAHAVEQVAQAMTALRITIGAGLLSLFVGAERSAANFEETFNRIQTVLPETGESADELRRKLSELRAETGQSAETVNQTYFKALSRMPRLAEDTDKAIELVRTALQAGATGFTTSTEAIRTAEAVLQGFNKEATDTEEVFDKLTVAQERAGVSMGEIGRSVSSVAAITDALGGSFEDLLAVYQTMVPTGQSVSEVNTQLRAVIQGLIDPMEGARSKAEELGIDMSAAAVRSEGLNSVIMDIIEATEGRPEVITKLFGRQEAVSLLVAMADRTVKLRTEMEALRDSQGEFQKTTDEMNESIDRQIGLIGREWQDSLTQLGFTLDELTEEVGLNFIKLLRIISEVLTAVINKGLESVAMFNKLTDALVALGSGQPGKAASRLREVRDIIAGTLLDAAPEAFGTRDFFRNEMLPAFGLSDQQIAEIEGRSETLRRIVRENLVGGRLRGAIEEARAALERERPLPEHEMPARADFTLRRIERLRRLGDLRAQMARMRGRSEEHIQFLLEETQRRVNRLVETQMERMRAHDASEQALARVASEWEKVRDVSGEVRDISEQTAASIEEGMAQSAEEARQQFRELAREGLELDTEGLLQLEDAPDEFEQKMRMARRRIEELANQGELSFENVQAAIQDSGLTMEEFTTNASAALAALIRKVIRLREESEDMPAPELARELDKMASVSRGILDAADAMGELDAETRQTLSSFTSLVEAGSQIARGNFAVGGIQGAGALANLISSAFGRDRVDREADQAARSLERLRRSAEALREAFRGLTGTQISRTRGILEGMEGSDLEEFAESDVGGLVTMSLEETGLQGLAEKHGMSVQGFIDTLESMGLEVNDLQKLADGAEVSTEALNQELEAARKRIQELRLERLFEGFEGQMNRIERRFELFDIEDPIEQLEKIRETFLEFADLPDPLEQMIAGADLSTEAGRRAMEEALQRVFEMLEAGELAPEQLGGLTPSQLLDVLSRMEGLTDEAGEAAEGAAGGEGTTEAFQVTRQITEVTANRMIGTLTTISVLARQRNRILSGMASALGATVPESVAPPPRAATSSGGGRTVNEGDQLSVGPVNVSIRADGPLDREDGREAARGFVEVLDERLGAHERMEERRAGRRRRRR